MPHDIFLAYPTPARALVEPIYAALSGRGLSVCMDVHSLPAGEAWDLWLPKALSAARVVVVFVTPDYDKAFFLRSEVNRTIAAFRAGRQMIIPVYAAGAHPGVAPYGLDLIQALTLEVHGTDAVVQAAAGALTPGTPAGPVVPPPSPPKGPPKRSGPPWLTRGEVDHISDVALASHARLTQSRAFLLSALPPLVVADLPVEARTFGERLVADLATLNQFDALPPEVSPPVAQWLDAAVRATRNHRADRDVFSRYRALLP